MRSLQDEGALGQAHAMIALFTDFGLHGPYTGQMKAVLHQMAPGIAAIDLFADAPVGNPKASAYLLAVYAGWFPAGTVFLCVVDPGVGGARPAIILEADGRWYVGPGNGLFELGPAPCQKDAQLGHRLEPRTPFGKFSWARPLRTGRGHAGARRATTRPAVHGWRGSPGGLAGRPLRDRLRRPFRQCHDRVEGGHAPPNEPICGARSSL
jgi:S-adenosyl-l-methionine hydroxide adenosyltransferase